MTTVKSNLPSWLQPGSDSDEESVANRKQLQLERIQERQFQSQIETKNNLAMNTTGSNLSNRDSDVEDDSDDEEGRNQGAMLPANLQVREPSKRSGGIFRRGRRADAGSISTDQQHPEPEESGSVATRSYMKGFSGNTVQSSATASSILSVLSRFLPFGLNKKDGKGSESDQKNASRPPLPPKKTSPLAPSAKDTRKKNDRRSTQRHDEQPDMNVHSSIKDPTPTYKSISTLDTEEATLEGGVPSVIYCFIKVNPHDDDDDDDEFNGQSSGVRAYLPKAIAKRLPKRKQPKLFIDEDDEESYFQTLVDL